MEALKEETMVVNKAVIQGSLLDWSHSLFGDTRVLVSELVFS